jgi:ATP-dependent Clp protease ATP-binding subunit ClpA
VLFVDEVHTLVGAGGTAGTGDAANLLKPALARGRLRTIGATTWSEYKKYIEKDPALTRRFQTIQVQEPTEDKAVIMGDMKEVFAEAKGEGFDVKILRKVIRMRKQDRAKRLEEEALIDLYLAAIGGL